MVETYPIAEFPTGQKYFSGRRARRGIRTCHALLHLAALTTSKGIGRRRESDRDREPGPDGQAVGADRSLRLRCLLPPDSGLNAPVARCPFCAAGQHHIAKSGSKTLHLSFDLFGHIQRRPVRDVTIGPPGMPACGGARRIEQTWLGQQHERLLRVLPVPGGAFRGFYLFETASEMHRGALRALGVSPGDGSIERPVDLEHTGAIAEAAQTALVLIRKALSRDSNHLAGSQVEEHGTRRRQALNGVHWRIDLNGSAERQDVGGERARDPLRATARNRPAPV